MADELDLDAIKARAAAATPGPWERDGYDVYESQTEHGDVVAEAGLSGSDAKFIAHARTDVPLLVAEVRRLRDLLAEHERLRQELRRAEDEHAEFLEELDVAFGLEDGEEARYSNPEGAAEAIYVDVAAAYKAERDAARAALAEIRDRHRRHGDRCGECERGNQISDHPRADECDYCTVPYPCWHRTTAERGLGAEEET